ncbi:hypothetical protein AWM75_06890 [Aerococcus urinaehominis]|uniref:Uncharacterized protein n=1 Tax=Aerococcus urinaehominis TaxID=128944 RepID=A0A0X8FN58_9LACT|nr:TIGR01906 family membrane protein [Aerococcus urinaehominis]AMB99727.1 hypothetical protein AWM75_06890 [Aerococcus urinaehominis]SDL92102.1 integral membrane protein TIGR01906 [Aerococcus urinaehominis]
MAKISYYIKFIVLMLAMLALAISLTIALSPAIFYVNMKLGLIQPVLNFSQAEILSDYGQMMAYLHSFTRQPLSFNYFAISTAGAFHFYEVRRLFYLVYVCLFVLGPYTIYQVKHGFFEEWACHIKRDIKRLIVFLIGLLVLLVLNFSRFFTLFHQIFFNNNAWIFDPRTDPIILVLTEGFFLQLFALALCIFLGGLAWVNYYIKKPVTKIN